MQRPIPLRPDYTAHRTSQERALIHAVTATLLAFVHKGGNAREIAAREWPGERHVGEILTRAVSAPAMTSTSGWAAELAGTRIADFLFNVGAPSASAGVLRAGINVDLENGKAVTIPFVVNDKSGASFVGEGAPLPAKNFNFSAGVTVGLRKFGVLVPFTREIFEHSVPSIERIVTAMLLEATALQLDSVMFDANAATSVRPAGLLFGANAAMTAANGSDLLENMREDIAALVASVSKVSSGAPVVLIGAPGQAERMRLGFVGPVHEIFSSSALAAKTVVAIATNCFVSTSGESKFDVGKDPTIHMEDTTPLPRSAVATPNTVAAPMRSFWQTDSVALRMIWPIDYALRSKDALAYMTAVTWGPQS